ncbi:sensor histidine kinase [Planctomonas deserti]|uniref:sensor histidine kinase n=1 Tax=Planctomonas deserti TaxID=2144185 RepID=UPI000D3C5266|nr:ATP-binding protein [Planctomonas deserti]
MDTGLLVLVSLALGLAVGSGFTWLLHHASLRGQRAAEVITPAVPDGVDEVIDALESAGIVLDPSNNVMKASPAAHAFGLVWNAALVHPELVRLTDRVRRSGESLTEELELSRGPFSEASLYMIVRAARLGARYVLLIADDRTESVRLESVRRDFIANISHELKTPIGAVGLLAEALQVAADEPDQVRRFADRLTAESTRLAHITQEIIELSRLQAADALAKPELVRLDAVVSRAVDQNRVVAEARRIRLVTGGDLDAEVYGDEALLVTALHNLVANAITYSPDGSHVGIGVRRSESVVELAVTDQGVGIPESDLDRVFERFFRVDQARARNTGGTGLGLAIVKHVAQNHGGDVRVWSQLGRGSTFTIRLPAASPADDAGIARPTAQPIARSTT